MLGNEMLRREAVAFAPVGGSEAKQVVEQLLATAAANKHLNAVGLAAPQVEMWFQSATIASTEKCAVFTLDRLLHACFLNAGRR
jgi:peptide deformylase